MRRKDKKIVDRKEIEKLLERGILCSIAFADGNEPYLVTVNYGYRDGCIYFHSAKTGKKIEFLRKNRMVCFQVVLDDELIKGDNACNDFTMKFRSVVGYGKVVIVDDPEEKKKGLNILMKQHTGRGDYEFGPNSLKETAVLRIGIESITGKKSGY